MLYYKEYRGHNYNLINKRNPFDDTIYTFDIETTSYLKLNNKIYKALDYEQFNEEDKEKCEKKSLMYIWMLGINDVVYYGRTWLELDDFLCNISAVSEGRKFLFIHNASFEFQYLKSYFNVENVFARKSHKVIKFDLADFNFEVHCTYFMSNCSLKLLPKIFNLNVEKQVGDLDYSLIRTPDTILSEKELKYCENDCLVVYEYIKRELETYKTLNKIPITSTGHVRKELKDKLFYNWKYKMKVRKAINVNPLVYNKLIGAFQGGYTHSNFIYTDEILHNINIDSWDFTSSYPYVLCTHLFPMTKFKPCEIKDVNNMFRSLAYLLTVKFRNIKCKYFNNFISASKCRYIVGGKYDNGRIMEATEIEMILTDIDFYFILDAYNCEYEIVDSWYSSYNYLPKDFIDFVLEKYVNKTKFKNVVGKEVDYALEKNKFNSLYGMCVTNNIRDDVQYIQAGDIWVESQISDDEIRNKLNKEEKDGFLSFAWGVWCTAHARNNLLRNVLKLDEYAVYMDTDSIKVLPRL